jgi:phenylacetate-coenzyme A ligase PaaK-like adenylate-forming protein
MRVKDARQQFLKLSLSLGEVAWSLRSRIGDKAMQEREDSVANDVFRSALDAWSTFTSAAEMWWTRNAGLPAVTAAATRRSGELIAFARAHSPFYRRAWRAVKTPELSLADLPVVGKRELMASFDDWMTDRSVDRRGVEAFLADRTHIGEYFLGRYVIWKSSGSTGEPGIFVQDRAALATYDALLAVQLQSAAWAGGYLQGLVARGGRAALIAATGDHFASISSWQRICRGSPWPNARAFSVMEPLPTLVAALNEYQPAFVASYPTTLAMLALEQRAGRLRIAPACLWSGGEYLSPAAHLGIERAFGAVLVNEYGASECMSIAYSCNRGSLHVNADWVVLEPVDREYRPVPPGQPSHTVLLTNLANRIAPIIRYDLGDSITWSVAPCGCGSPLPSICAEGRCDDVLALSADDGTTVRLSPLAVTTVLEEAMPNGRFQLVQSGPGSLDLRISAKDDAERQLAWRSAQAALHAYLAQQSLPGVHIRLADEAPMPDARSGKLREVIAEHRARDASIEESRFAVPLERPEKAPAASRRGIIAP